jgi:hypothetical protein
MTRCMPVLQLTFIQFLGQLALVVARTWSEPEPALAPDLGANKHMGSPFEPLCLAF